MMMALTVESLLKSPMLRSDSLASERLSLTTSSIFRAPRAPEAFNCSTFRSRARWYALPTGAAAPESSRSAPMMIGLLSSSVAPNGSR